jgi:hypothetical protein
MAFAGCAEDDNSVPAETQHYEEIEGEFELDATLEPDSLALDIPGTLTATWNEGMSVSEINVELVQELSFDFCGRRYAGTLTRNPDTAEWSGTLHNDETSPGYEYVHDLKVDIVIEGEPIRENEHVIFIDFDISDVDVETDSQASVCQRGTSLDPDANLVIEGRLIRSDE